MAKNYDDQMEKPKNNCSTVDNGSYPACGPCNFEDLDSSSSAFCLICVEYLCQQCIRDHRKNKASRNHRILEEGEIPTNAKTCQFLKEFLLCKNHSDREVRYKCKNHDVFVCDICIGTDHRDCVKIKDLSEHGKANNTEPLEKSLLELQERLQLCMETKHKSKEKLLKEVEHIKTQQQNYLTSIMKHLDKLYIQGQNEFDEMAQFMTDSNESSVAKCKTAETTLSALVQVLAIATNFDKLAFKHVVKDMIAKQIKQIEGMINEENSKGEIHFRFIPFASFEEINTIGEVKLHVADMESASEDAEMLNSVYKGDKYAKDLDQESNENGDTLAYSYALDTDANSNENKEEAHINEDTKAENATVNQADEEMSRSRRSSSDNTKKFHEFPWKNKKTKLHKRHDVREKNDSKQCTIVGITIFPDGFMALLDSTNRKIKIFNTQMELVNFLLLSNEPIAMTEFQELQIALLCHDGNQISVFDYLAGVHNINKVKQFGLRRKCSSLSHNTKYIFLLEKNFKATILICDIHEEKIVQKISCKSDFFCNPNCFMYMNEDTFIVGNDRQICCFDNTGKQMWFYKQYNNINEMKDVVSFTADENGNLLACCQRSENVHAVSAENYRFNSVVLFGLCGMTAVRYDAIKKNLVVGYSDDNISVFTFQNKVVTESWV